LEQAELLLIRKALSDTNGNVSEAARRLGISRMALRYRIQKLGIETSQSRQA
jgi:DNA-binding NtrC family response regulator